MLTTLRRRLAACALALVVCQTGVVFAAPMSSCCAPRPAAEAEKDCCPAGAHAPGQCPLHARAKASKSSPKVECRIRCDAPHGAQFLLGTVGLLPAPVTSIAPALASRVAGSLNVDPETLVFVPDSPPPRV